MKDIKNLVIYGGSSLLVILMLANMDALGNVSEDVVGYLAIFLVIVLPVALAVVIAKKEKQKRESEN